MSTHQSLQILLTPEFEKLVHEKVQSGDYPTASEVVRAGLELLQERDQEIEGRLRELRQGVQHALDQARRGELLDGEAVFDELGRLDTLDNEAE